MRLAHVQRAVGRRGRREAGETLIETLATIIILTLVVVAVLSALLVLVRTAALNREKTRAAVAVSAVAEQISQPVAPNEYIPCGGAGQYTGMINNRLQADTDAGLRNYRVEVTNVEYLQGTWNTNATSGEWRFAVAQGNNPFDVGCPGTRMEPGSMERDGGLQRLTVEISTADSNKYQLTERLMMVKRDARCSTTSDSYTNPDAGPC